MIGSVDGDWRAKARAAIEAEFATARRGESIRVRSLSGQYALEVVDWHTAGGWDYAEGVVRSADRVEPITRVRRNFGIFPFTWCEGHPNGHDYLVVGEDYQGQTIVELDTGRRMDHLPPAAEQGTAFCWAAHHLSRDRTLLIVDGCYWACPYDLVAYDFTDPMQLPYRELHRWPGSVHTVAGFDTDGELTWTFSRGVRLSDGKPSSELTEDELSDLMDETGRYSPALLGSQACRARWRAGSPFDSTEIEVLDGLNN